MTAHAALPQQHRPDDRAGVHRGRRAPTARRLLIVAERDGDTVSPERGVYLVDLTQHGDAARSCARASTANLDARAGAARQGQAAVRADRRRREARSSPRRPSRASTATRRRCSTSTRSTSRSRATSSRPTYLFDTYKSFGYEPEYQWFDTARGALERPDRQRRRDARRAR